jgi:hypothetical protein
MPARADGRILKVVEARSPGLDGWRLSCDPCRGKGKHCLSVEAFEGQKTRGRLVLEEDSSCAARESDALRVQIEANADFKLAPAVHALLVKVEQGGEAISDTYWLVGFVDARPLVLWTASYGTEEVVPIASHRLAVKDQDGNGRDEIDFLAPWPLSSQLDVIKGRLRAGELGDEVDRWEHQRLEYDDVSKRMRSKPVSEWAAAVGPLDSAVAGVKYKLQLIEGARCRLDDFLVLSSKAMPRLGPWPYALASIAPTEKEAAERLKRIKACDPRLTGQVRQIAP